MNVSRLSSTINEWSKELQLQIADALFCNTSEGICITDNFERIIEVNPTFCRITGYHKDELLGKTPRILNSGLQDRNFFADMRSALLNTGEWHGELWNRNKSGEIFAVRLNISAMCDGSGEVSHYLAIMADITAMKLQQQGWEQNASHDQLTGLPNRLLLTDLLQQALAQSQRTGLILAICYLDLDGFKAVNDIHGHEVGDHVLIEVAQRLHHSVRQGDTVARVGGDEFVILLWGLDNIQECDRTLGRVVSEIDRPILLDNSEVSISVSIGVTIFPRDGNVPAMLTAQADSAMYRSKVAGGNRFTYF